MPDLGVGEERVLSPGLVPWACCVCVVFPAVSVIFVRMHICMYASIHASMPACLYMYTKTCIYEIVYLFVDMDRAFWKLVIDRELHA